MATFESDRARPDSLLKWVNTFGISVESFADLSSGTLLLECLQTVLPELTSTTNGHEGDPWKITMKAFEDFYGGSLEKSVSLADIRSSSDQEQLARVIVLLLLIAVQRKPNEDMIARITTLDFWTQRDIMYYIESALGKANSHTLVAGGFTSGIGDPLPDLEDHSLAFGLVQDSPTSTDMTVTPTNSTATACETFVSDPTPTPTPLRRTSSHCLYPNRYYLGLESPAGLRWLQSPAITTMPGRSSTKKRVCQPDATMEEEVLKLRHRVRVLERSLESETKISQDLYTEVCQKTYCFEQLEVHCNQLEGQVEELADLRDLQDELHQCREKLLVTERSLTRSRNEADTLRPYKAKCATLETESEEFRDNSAKISQYEQMVNDLDTKLLHITSENRVLELNHQTTAIKLQARNEEVEILMKQNRESLREVRESTQRCEALQEARDEALLKLEEKSEGEQAALREKRRLDVEIENLQNQLEVKEGAFSHLTIEGEKLAEEKCALRDKLTLSESQIHELQTQLIAQESALSSLRLERDELAEEKAVLLNKCSASESQLQDAKIQLEIHESTLSSLTLERDELVEAKATTEERVTSSQSKIHELQTELTELDQLARERAALLDKCSATESQLQSQLNVQESTLSSLTLERDELVEATTALKDRVTSSESKIHELQAELHQVMGEKAALLDKCSASEAQLQDAKTQLKVQESTLSSLTLERDELVEAKTTLEDRVTSSESKIQELQTELTDLNQLREERAALLDKCSSSETQLQDVTAKYELLARDLRQAHEHYQSDLENKRRELQLHQEKSNADVLSLTAERDELTEVKTSLEHKLTLLESRMQELLSQLEIQESTLSSLTLERDKLVEAKATTEDVVTSSKSKIQELQTELHQVMGEKAALLDECSTSEAQLQDVKTQLKVQESTLSSLTLERDELVEAKTTFEDRVTSSNSKIQELQTELTDLDQLREERAALLDKCSSSETQLQDVTAKYELLARDLRQAHEHYQSDLENKRRELQLHQEKSNADVLSLTAERDELTEVKTSLEHKLTLLESRMQELLSQLEIQESTLSSLTLERDKLVEAKATTEDVVTSSKSKIQGLQTELHQVTGEKAALLDECSTSEAQLQDVKSQLKVQESTLSSLTLERNELVGAKSNLEDRVTSSESKIHKLQTELHQVMGEKAALLDKCSTSDAQLQDVKTQLKVQESTLSSLALERNELVEAKSTLEDRVSSSESKIYELQTELTVLDQLTEERAALLDKCSASESQLHDVKAKYEQLARELKRTHKHYQSDLETIKDKNRELQLSQEKVYADLCKENHASLKKQTKLHEEVEELRGMQGEMTALCQQYKDALDKTKKLLAKEQHHGAKLASENKSLEAQLGFASQKLRDLEKRKNSRAASPPPPSRQSSRLGSTSSCAPRMLSSCELRTNEEDFYSRLQEEFDSTVGSIPFESDDPQSDDSEAENSFRSLSTSSKTITKINPRRATLAVPSLSSSHWHSSLAAIQEDEEEENGGGDSRVRISELQRRNAKALPHLKSSYPIEMQVQPESPNNSDDHVKNAVHRKRDARELYTNTSADLQTTSKAGFLSTEAHQSRKRTISSRKRAERFSPPPFDPLTTSPLPTRRRTSAPPTPNEILTRQPSQIQKSRHSTMASNSIKLREYLDRKTSDAFDDPKPILDDSNPRRQSTVFEIAFSPPRVRRAPPKRLQQQENARVTLPKQRESKPSGPKPTAFTATVTKSRPAHSRKPVLKSKN